MSASWKMEQTLGLSELSSVSTHDQTDAWQEWVSEYASEQGHERERGLKVRLGSDAGVLSPKEHVGDVLSRHRVGGKQRQRGRMNSTEPLASSWSLTLVF